MIFLTGELALALRKADEARDAFLRLAIPPVGQDTNAVTDGYDLRVRLALTEIHRRDLIAAEDHLKRAVAFDPGSAGATGLLVELLGDASWHGSRDEDRLRAIAATLQLEPMHAKLARELVFGLARRGRVAQVVEAAPLAIFIEPGLPALHAAYGRALAATGRHAAAAAALERALALGPSADDEPDLRVLLHAMQLKLSGQHPASQGRQRR